MSSGGDTFIRIFSFENIYILLLKNSREARFNTILKIPECSFSHV